MLYGTIDIDHVNQYWVPLLGEIIMNDRKPYLSELLAFNLHANWEITKLEKDFFMSYYIVDAWCAYLEFNYPLFSAWPHPSNSPIHVLFGALYMHNYRKHVIIIFTHFYPPIYKDINGTNIPKLSKVVKQYLSSIKAWWYFKYSTIIIIEGTLIPPTTLPPYVFDRIISLEVAR